jgi:hypothetical protein
MPTILKTKNSVTTTVVPTTLQQGELAVNITDKKLWVGNAATTPVQLLGDGGSASFTSIAFGAGTVSAPSITFTGDTNTGIYSPAADTIAFTEGGVESMRIDSSGNVGIGTNNPLGSFNAALAVVSPNTFGTITAKCTATSGAAGVFVQNDANTADCFMYAFNSASGSLNASIGTSKAQPLTFLTNNSEKMRITSVGDVVVGGTAALNSSAGRGNITINGSSSSILNLGTGGTVKGYVFHTGTDMTLQNDVNGFLNFVTNGTERMRIDSSGNVGIGTASPSFPLDVVSNSSSNAIQVRGRSSDNVSRVEFRSNNAATHFGTLVGYSNYMAIEAAQASGIIAFNTNSSERMRIDSSGNLQLGVTNGDARFNVTANGGSLDVMKWTDTRTGATSSNMAVIVRNGSVVGTIRTTDVATAYNTSSDYRLKENIAPMTGALAKVAQIKPCTYTWKLNGSEGQGFIAHELAEVIPQAVSGEKDAIDKNGNPEYQGIDTSFLVATLTAAIQEQQTLINNLTTRLNALEGK